MVATNRSDRPLAMLAHASFWFFPVLLPLAIYLTCRRSRPWPAAHAAEASNFQATVAVTCVALFAVASIASSAGVVAIVALIAIWLAAMVAAATRIGASGNDLLRPYKL